MKMLFTFVTTSMLSFAACACSSDDVAMSDTDKGIFLEKVAEQNAARAVEIIDNAMGCYFPGEGASMTRYYNPYTKTNSTELASVWMYTSSIEAVNAAMKAMKKGKEKGSSALYDENFDRYKGFLEKLYDNLEFYAGTYTLTSYTQTKEWTIYGVNRGRGKGAAEVEGVQNVYDDQMWLIRELIESYRLTGEQKYLEKAEYLTSYVLDGWDCTLDENGIQNGGITWGPGYVTKHSCSNGPLISSLVWLHEIYKGKSDEVTYGYVAEDNSRKQRVEKKSDYYLNFAKAVYDYQKEHLMNPAIGVYDDMMGGYDSPDIKYVEIDGNKYRDNTKLRDRVGPAISYNSGTMLSGAADLFEATGDEVYRKDMIALSDKSFAYFAKADAVVKGYYSFEISGFNNWFNGVLMRGYSDVLSVYPKAADYLAAFQKNLDYAYENFCHEHMLPTNLLVGWHKGERTKNNVEGMFTFAFAAEYAVLADYEWNR